MYGLISLFFRLFAYCMLNAAFFIRVFDTIKVNSAPGIDGISPKFLKMAKVTLTPFLTKL